MECTFLATLPFHKQKQMHAHKQNKKRKKIKLPGSF